MFVYEKTLPFRGAGVKMIEDEIMPLTGVCR